MQNDFNLHDAIESLVARVTTGPGESPASLRQAAFDNASLDDPLRTIVDKVALEPSTISDDDMAAARGSGLSEDQLFELVICAAIGQAFRHCQTALAALDGALVTGEDQHAP